MKSVENLVAKASKKYYSHAAKILADYHKGLGGKPDPQLKGKKSKQSLRQEEASPADSPAPAAKRQKRNGGFEREEIPEESWTPNKEDWEPLVNRIDTVEKDETGQLLAYIMFNNGKKTKVSMDKVYRHCPRPMLKFYENHLKFK